MSYLHIKSATSFEDLRHDCTKYKELRARNKGNGLAYAYQCQFCGEFRGGEVSKKSVSEHPPYNDECLYDAYRDKYLELISAKSTHIAEPIIYSNLKTALRI